MHSAPYAESLLALVTSQERAAAMVGDFTESSLGALWFWSSVLRAGFSLLWKDAAANPGRMTELAAGGAVMVLPLSIPFFAGVFALTFRRNAGAVRCGAIPRGGVGSRWFRSFCCQDR